MSGYGGARFGRRYNRQVEQRIDGDLWPEARLVLALLARALMDAMNGDPGARLWLTDPAFESWCAWLDINPDRLRARVWGRQ